MIEIIGGFLVRSQALKADALDFLGNGLITFIVVLALAWSATTRARVALVQGCFLVAMGLWRDFRVRLEGNEYGAAGG